MNGKLVRRSMHGVHRDFHDDNSHDLAVAVTALRQPHDNCLMYRDVKGTRY